MMTISKTVESIDSRIHSKGKTLWNKPKPVLNSTYSSSIVLSNSAFTIDSYNYLSVVASSMISAHLLDVIGLAPNKAWNLQFY